MTDWIAALVASLAGLAFNDELEPNNNTPSTKLPRIERYLTLIIASKPTLT
jgi:hypothetical protein